MRRVISKSYKRSDSFDVRVVILHTPVTGTRRDFLWRIPTDRRSSLSESLGKPSITFELLCFPRYSIA